jgi:hypothetical protein
MTCLSRDRLIEAVEGAPIPETAQHLATCARCRAEVESLRQTLDEVRGVDVPEPSPLFWDHLTARVREAIAAEPSPDAASFGLREWLLGGRNWWRPATAVALVLIAALAVDWGARRSGRTSDGTGEVPLVSTRTAAAVDLAAGDDWQFIVDVAAHAADHADGEAGDAGAIAVIDASSGSSELALSDLSSDEQRELVKLLNDELTRKGDV